MLRLGPDVHRVARVQERKHTITHIRPANGGVNFAEISLNAKSCEVLLSENDPLPPLVGADLRASFLTLR